MRVSLPPVFAINLTQDGNTIQQLLLPPWEQDMIVEPWAKRGIKGSILRPNDDANNPIFAFTGNRSVPAEYEKAIRLGPYALNGDSIELSNLATAEWIRYPGILQEPIDFTKLAETTVASWHNALAYLLEDEKNQVRGLRTPQSGAVHAIHAHWAVSNKAATIVMPTGTGKTETMISTLISAQCQRVLVIVPTDALRTQIGGKFITLGLLRELGVVTQKACYPIVGMLKHRPISVDEVDEFFKRCNVIVTTMSIAGQCSAEIQNRMAFWAPFLFIDEAHHIAAQTWDDFKKQFATQKVLQFTATPFRNDDKPIGGKIIFSFPLRAAQKQGYFRPIRFKPISEFDSRKADLAIAESAVAQLRNDLKLYNHILMARVGNIERAKEVFAIYQRFPEFNPVQIHTGIKSAREREQIRRKILSGESKIVVCVDMLGEGFDLPELKIAAFHDIRKSLAVTLQLAGRFVRSRRDLGDPTFIANIADVVVRDELKRLYAQDADWNTLLPQTSEKVIQEQVDLWEFIDGFNKFPEDIPLQNIRPATSAVIYKTKCTTWSPDNFLNGIESADSFERIHYDLNPVENTLVIVTARKASIDWAQIKDIYNWDWELLILFWDRDQNLLFINSSSNSGYYQELAESVAGEVELVKGLHVFRCLAGVNRLKLQNVGLIEQLGRLIRYTMRAGPDVEPGLTPAQKQHTRKANLFGAGYEDGHKTSIGCSYKGRVWSRRVSNLHTLIQWCRLIGRKVLDPSIDPDEVLKGTLVPVIIIERPPKIPVYIEWPEEIYSEPESAFEILFDDRTSVPLYFVDIRLKDPSDKGKFWFELYSDSVSVDFTLDIFEKDGIANYKVTIGKNRKATIRRGASQILLEDFFMNHPPVIWFADGSSLEGNSLIELKRKPDPYGAERILAWDWTGINIRKESQGIDKEPNSVQARVIRELKNKDYSIVYDDDNPGEVADVVTIRDNDDGIIIELYHCKYSLGDEPGTRIKDLYEVCGQAQKSIRWAEKPENLIRHLMRREPKKEKGREVTRFERGDRDVLQKFLVKSGSCQTSLRMFIVQPGLAKSKISSEQLELLGVTENYLMETYKLPFGVIASP